MNEISALVERFGRNREAYLSGDYNETQFRSKFIVCQSNVLSGEICVP